MYSTLRLFCDGCAGQNKNSHIIHTLYFWLTNKFPKQLREIQVTFPVRGHSFLPVDRVFGRVEKRLRKSPTIIDKEDYLTLYSEFGYVKSLGRDWNFLDKNEETAHTEDEELCECLEDDEGLHI